MNSQALILTQQQPWRQQLAYQGHPPHCPPASQILQTLQKTQYQVQLYPLSPFQQIPPPQHPVTQTHLLI
jgi:hypothetical protein